MFSNTLLLLNQVTEAELCDILSDGILLIEVVNKRREGLEKRIEYLSGGEPQFIDNCNKLVSYIQNERDFRINGVDIVYKKPKAVLQTLKHLLEKLHIDCIPNDSPGSAKNKLLKWIRQQLPESNINNFKKVW